MSVRRSLFGSWALVAGAALLIAGCGSEATSNNNDDGTGGGQTGSATGSGSGSGSSGQGGSTSSGSGQGGATTSSGQGGESTTSSGEGGSTTSSGEGGGTTSSGEGGSSSSGQGGGGVGGAAASSSSSGGNASSSSSSGPGGGCAGKSDVDNDGDGYTEQQGDCNDCDPATNPGAVDVISVDMNGVALPPNQQFDEDCDGVVLLPGQDPTCDNGNLAIDSNDPIHGANAMDICKISMNGSWGIVKAEYLTIDNKPLPDPLGHGILGGFGPNVKPQLGSKMLGLSSGAARAPNDPGYQDPSGYSKGYTSAHPPGFPIESPSCPGVLTGTPNDSAALKLTLKVPTNAKSFSFKFKFYTWEFPSYICSQFNDFFVALMDPPPADVDPVNKNIAFDAQGNPISVNNALLDVCTPGTYGGKMFACPGNIAELTGTGFESHAATSWLQTNAPVTPGSTITLTFGAYDSGDGVLDSTVLIDAFQWSAEPAKTGTNDACLSGGVGTCDLCVSDAVAPDGCCEEQWDDCQSNQQCAKLSGCVSLCKNNDVCIQGCYNNYPAGVPQYEDTLECLYGEANKPDSVGACGVVCK